MRLYLLLVTVLFGLASCAYPPANVVSEYPDECATGEQPNSNMLLFVTERVPDCVAPQASLTKFRGSQLLFGGIDKSYGLHFYRKADWLIELKQRLKGAKTPLLFVHGYNNSGIQSLKDAFAIEKAVQPGGEVIAFAWPSYDRLVSYTGDEANADWASDGLSALISDPEFDSAFQGSKLTLLAHSMGNRLVLDALRLMPSSNRSAHIARFIMASPDVDRAKLIGEVQQLQIPVTIYGSTKDQALSGSWRVHGLPRAGDLATWITGHKPDFALKTLGQVEVVDTSKVTRGIIHHSDYIDTDEGAADLCRVVNGRPPEPGRLPDERGHWLLAKGLLGPPTDPCTVNGPSAAEWLRKQ